MRRWFITAVAVCLGVTGGPVFASSLVNFNYLNNVKAFSTKRNVRFAINFKNPIKDYKGPVFFAKSIQVDFPGAYLNPSRRKFQVGDELIKEIQAYQFKKDVVRVRFVLAHSRYDLDKNFTLESRGKRLLLSLKKQPVDPLTSLLETRASEATDASDEAAGVPAKPGKEKPRALPGGRRKVSGSDTLPKALFKSLNPSEKGHGPENPAVGAGQTQVRFTAGEDTPDFFSAGVKIYAMLFLVLSFFFLLFHLSKKYFFQGSGVLGKNRLIDVIVTNPLGAKKAISLVEVAGEILVLGISNSHISMLTCIQDEETVKRLKQYKTRFPMTNPLGGFRFPFSFLKKHKAGSSSPRNFSRHLESFSSGLPQSEFSEPGQTAADVARLIQERLEKAKQGEAFASPVRRAG